jgi:hypothetical protein
LAVERTTDADLDDESTSPPRVLSVLLGLCRTGLSLHREHLESSSGGRYLS